jgi:Putative collagen-binding domain of a collagenase
VKTLFTAYAWHKLVPRFDGTHVTSGLSSGSSRICPALASDGSYAMVLTTGASLTVKLSTLVPGQLRARWFNTLDGSFSSASGAALTNSGLQTFTPTGERVPVLDAA